jgi:hypothetical protein
VIRHHSGRVKHTSSGFIINTSCVHSILLFDLPASIIHTDSDEPDQEACPHCDKTFQKKGLGNHKIHCPQRPVASAALRTPSPLTGVRGALRGVVADAGAGALAPQAASTARLEAMLERVLEQAAPRSAQLAERKPQDVAQQEWARLFREERTASQQASQQAFDERTTAADRAHEVTLKLALETNKNMLEALKATAASHARRRPDNKRKKKKRKERTAKNKSRKIPAKAQARTRRLDLNVLLQALKAVWQPYEDV